MFEKLNMGVPTPIGLTLISLLSLLVGGLTISEYFDIRKQETFMMELELLQAKIQEKKSEWETYTSEIFKFEIKYPKEFITLSEKQNKIFLSHSIDFEHDDPCDFKGEGSKLKELVDFNVDFEFFDGNLEEALRKSQGEQFVFQYFLNKKIKTEPGFIDESKIGNLTGYIVTQGVEGCGRYVYYFPLSSEKTLIIQRAFIPELQPIVSNYQKNLEMPGIILPEKEKILFEQIFSTLKLTD